MKVPYQKAQMHIWMRHGYLRLKIRTAYGRKTVISNCDVTDDDLDLSFWGDNQVRTIQDKIGLSQRERRLIAEGDILGKYVARDLVYEHARARKESRLVREESIRFTQEVLDNLHKLFMRERRQSRKVTDRVASGILPFMDGSVLLWLAVILSAKKDFLIGVCDPRRIEEWESLTPDDLLDENGGVKRGNEDAWSYVTARDFLFDDNYYIDIGIADGERNRAVNCEELLENVIEGCNSQDIDSTAIDPSIKRLRRSLAKKSGDPRLIETYCKE